MEITYILNLLIKYWPQILSILALIPSICVLALFYDTKLKILAKNLNRKIHLFYFSTDINHNLEMEKQMIEQSKLFKIDRYSNKTANLQHVNKKSLVVLGYTSATKDECNKTIDSLTTKGCPIIIYTYGDNAALTRDEISELQNKSNRITLCNFSMNLITNIFTIISTYNYD